MTFLRNIENLFPGKLKANESLAKYTTMGVGGCAKYFITVKSQPEMLNAVKIAREYQIPYFILGKGSNIIISDSGFGGLVIQNNILTFDVLENFKTLNAPVITQSRHGYIDKNLEIEKYGLSWDEKSAVQYIKAGSGWKLMALISKCVEQGLVGLEWFYGIAGSVGGAVYMNVHGGAHLLFSQFVTEVEVINENNELEVLPAAKLDFDYDYSIFHKQNYIITNVILKLFRGDKEKALRVINEWGREKIIKQPQRSSGCMFQNLPQDLQQKLNLPTPSMGYIIDKVLQLGGTRIGGAMISPRHCAFIENTGKARTADIKALVDLVKKQTQEKLGFEPKLEVEFVGD